MPKSAESAVYWTKWLRTFDSSLGQARAMASCEIGQGIPSNRNTERDNKGGRRPEQYRPEMQRQQRYAKSGKAGNRIGQHGCRRATAATMMQHEHDACVNNRA